MTWDLGHITWTPDSTFASPRSPLHPTASTAAWPAYPHPALRSLTTQITRPAMLGSFLESAQQIAPSADLSCPLSLPSTLHAPAPPSHLKSSPTGLRACEREFLRHCNSTIRSLSLWALVEEPPLRGSLPWFHAHFQPKSNWPFWPSLLQIHRLCISHLCTYHINFQPFSTAPQNTFKNWRITYIKSSYISTHFFICIHLCMGLG